VVAGKFYPLHAEELRAQLAYLIPEAEGRVRVHGVMVPHAGYVYSGSCAGKTLARAEIPETVLLMGPNHTGRGAALAAGAEDAWRTPLGTVELDRPLIEALEGEGVGVRSDARAHYGEHCLEVQLPFLQSLREGVRVAPLLVRSQRLEDLLELGRAIARVIGAMEKRPLLLISSDMTHYEPAASAERKDREALERLCQLDAEGLHETVHARGITMCGVGPAVAAVEAMRTLGATRGEEICYTHSGLVTGDDRDVVAYAGVLFH
jgi:AmmeMemoRadiSam system protein B